jgi:gamma-glutamyltranspeptidase/glutathione hydrolase
MLLAGGNAIDAAVAVGSTLNVVEPFMSSCGGIGLLMISRETKLTAMGCQGPR